MKQLGTGSELSLKGNLLCKKVDLSTNISGYVREWDLTKLVTLLTVDSLRDDAQRKRALQKQQKFTNMMVGAVLGGIIDGSSGDDSIIDGVLLGAAFGAICSTSLKNPTAQVGLLFCDGEHLALEVGKEDYTRLQTITASNQQKEHDPTEKSYMDRPLTVNEADTVLSDRVTNRGYGLIFAGFGMSFMPWILEAMYNASADSISEIGIHGERIAELIGMCKVLGACGIVALLIYWGYSIINPERELCESEEKSYNQLTTSQKMKKEATP